MNGDIRRTLHQTVLSRLDARKTGLPFSEDVGSWRDRAEEYCRRRCATFAGDAERAALRRESSTRSSLSADHSPALGPAVSEIMVNGFESIYVERCGLVTATQARSSRRSRSARRSTGWCPRSTGASTNPPLRRRPAPGRVAHQRDHSAGLPHRACLTVRKFRKEAFSLEELVLIGRCPGCRGVPERRVQERRTSSSPAEPAPERPPSSTPCPSSSPRRSVSSRSRMRLRSGFRSPT